MLVEKLEGKKVVVIGGCGHVGLPLGVKFALAGADTTLVDINDDSVQAVMSGKFPFLEQGGDHELHLALRKGLVATTDMDACRGADAMVFVIGTPVDEHLNPKLSDVLKIFDAYREYFHKDLLIVMRSTLFPGTMEHLYERMKNANVSGNLVFCPERVSQGCALEEIDSLPQIVSAFEDPAFEMAYELFAALAPSVIRLTPLEAEMTKLMANSWRYLEFAIANQFYMIAEKSGVDFYKIFEAIRYDYPRAQGYKAPGFAAGPCLFKDTMQLASFFKNQFYLGHAAMLVNEGLAEFTVEKVCNALGGSLWGKKVGLLGMAFKPNNDDIRESLSYRVKKALEFAGAEIIWHDPYLDNSSELSQVLESSDAIMMCTPHKEYKDIEFKCPVIDVWGVVEQPTLKILPGKEESDKLRKIV